LAATTCDRLPAPGPVAAGRPRPLCGILGLVVTRARVLWFGVLIEHVRDLTGIVYGRRVYEVMRYWDDDRSESVTEEEATFNVELCNRHQAFVPEL
jgi:hypothetical protein